MIHIIFLVGGVCCALLCHWMVRHTYTGYSVKELDECDNYGRKKKTKVWDKKMTIPRWLYILTWVFCILLAPLAIIVPILYIVAIREICDTKSGCFIYTNKFVEWLKKEV